MVLGHVGRMDYDMLPRFLLSSWVACLHPVSATNYTYGKGMQAALTYAGVDVETWNVEAQERVEWWAMLKDLNKRHKEQQQQQ